MKKVISIMLVTVVLVSVFITSANAETVDVSGFKYYERFVQYVGEQYRKELEINLEYGGYQELCYHYSDDDTEEPDWALLMCVLMPVPLDMKYGTVVGERVLSIAGGSSVGFSDAYGVYVKEIDNFIYLSQSNMDTITKMCPDFIKTIEENEIGQAFGDVDMDNKVTVLDATHIQNHLAGKKQLHHYDRVTLDGGLIVEGRPSYVLISDYDHDYETTILDATAIQRMLARLEI